MPMQPKERTISVQKNPHEKVSMAKHLEDELHLAAINMDKLATKGTKKRRRSADSNQLLGKYNMDDSEILKPSNQNLKVTFLV